MVENGKAVEAVIGGLKARRSMLQAQIDEVGRTIRSLEQIFKQSGNGADLNDSPDTNMSKNKRNEKRIKDFLKGHAGQGYPARKLSDALGILKSEARTAVYNLCRRGNIKKRTISGNLEFGGKGTTPRLEYYVDQ